MAILQQGQQYQGGTVQYDSATGKRLGTNEITVENKDLTANGQYPDMAKFNIPQANSAITTSSLAPAQPFVPAITQPYTAPIVAPLTAPKLDLTTQEQGALDQVSPYQQLIDQLSGSTSELAQKSFRKQQSESMGLNAANNLSQSLYDKSQSLDLRSQAIQAQKQADIQGLQNTAQQGGANVTKGGLAPQQRAIETRTNQQELSNTLDKLDNAVSYYASIGQVRQAQQKVDQAIDTEFTPKLLALDTAQRNLASLLKSPNLTAAQEKLALNRQAELTAQQDAIKEAAQLKKDTGDARIKALTNNPNMPQQQHDAISLAQSPEEVAQLVNYFGLSSISKSDQLDQTYKQAQIDKAQYDLAHPQKHTQVIEANNGHTILIDTDTGATVKDYGAKAAPTGTGVALTGSNLTNSANDWVSQFNSGLLTADEIYTKIGSAKESIPLRNEVARLIAQQKGKRVYGADDASIQAINSQIKNVDDLLNGDVGSIVGLVQGGLGVLPDNLNIYKQDALGIAKNLVSNQTLQALADAKSKGITFGALSERELTTVADAASSVAAKILKDKDGNITGFSGSQAQFKKDLQTIKDGLTKSIANKTKSVISPEDQSAIDSAFSSFDASNYFK